MKIILNGKDYNLDKSINIKDLLEKLEVKPEQTVVEHNMNIIKKHLYPEVILAENDRVEILSFMGGG